MKSRILLVDDDLDLLWALRFAMQEEYEVETAGDCQRAMARIGEQRPDLIVLDADMPGITGFELCCQMRHDPRFASIPVILLVALVNPADRVRGLDEGADDCLTKPFELEELKARIRAVLRRSTERHPEDCENSSILELDLLRVDLRAKCVHVRGTPTLVTPAEFALIAFLAANPGEVFSARQLLDKVWGYPPGTGNPDLVRWHIKNIRSKIELEPQNPEIIRTVRAYGYLLDQLPREPSGQGQMVSG